MSDEEERLRALVNRMPAKLRERYDHDAIAASVVYMHALAGSSYETMLGDLACHLAEARDRLERELAKLHKEGMPPLIVQVSPERAATLAQRIDRDAVGAAGGGTHGR